MKLVNNNILILFISIFFLSCEVFYPYEDDCGVVDGDNSCLDCAGVPRGNAELDYCGVCDGTNECANVLLNIDFESGDFPDYFTSDWEISDISFDGNYSASSTNQSNNSSSNMSFNTEIIENSVIQFRYKVSSEANDDKLTFYIDNSMVFLSSGEINWRLWSYEITPGTHTFKWSYLKDGYSYSGSDKSWVDFIQIFSISTN